MRYPLFLAFNAAGGLVWSALYVFGFYYAGSTLKGVRGTFDIVLGALAAVIVVAALAWMRSNVKRLEAEAELAYPGQLEDHMGAHHASAAQ
jgi:membrane-associated protein